MPWPALDDDGIDDMSRANGSLAVLISPFLMLLMSVVGGPLIVIGVLSALVFVFLVVPVDLIVRASTLKPAPLRAFSWIRACATGAATALCWFGMGQLLWIYSGPGSGALIPACIMFGIASGILTAAATLAADLISAWRTNARLPKPHDSG